MIHVHRHDEDSLLDGCGTATQYANRAAALDQWALSQTNHATLAGSLKHGEACRAAGIVPIFGCEAYFRRDRTVREDKDELAACYHFILIAKNLRGWVNLMRATSAAYASGYYGRPALDWSVLEQYSEGLIATTACIAGKLAQTVLTGDDKGADAFLNRMKSIFRDDLYVEIMPHNFDNQRTVNIELSRLAAAHNLPLIAGQDAHVPYEEWCDTHEIVWLISTASSFAKREQAAKKREEKGEDAYQLGSENQTLYLTSEDEMLMQFAEYHPQLDRRVVEEAAGMTDILAGTVEPFLMDSSLKIPQASRVHAEAAGEVVLEGEGPERIAELICRHWIMEGMAKLAERPGMTPAQLLAYEERRDFELDVWRHKRVFGYFYVVSEGVRWAKGLPGTMGQPVPRPLRVGAGRGSACASLLLYLMGVTGVDPITHGLIFERFMNPHRADMPDVDIDFQHDRIEEVRDHYREAYGSDNVAQIVAHQRFGPKAVIAAVSRAFDVPYPEHLAITKGMDDEAGELDLEQIRETNKELAAYVSRHPEVYKHAQRLEGQVARLARHASGVVVLDRAITDFMPTMTNTPNGDLLTSWSAQAGNDMLGKYGFPKLDFLSTDGLSRQARALELIERNHGVLPDVDNLPVMWDADAIEQDVLDMFASKRCFGTFQFGGRGIQEMLQAIRPTSFRDLVACNASYRPGSGAAEQYADRKNGREEWVLLHPSLEPVLGNTFGLFIYQEQIVNVFCVLGGFTPAEGDELRKIVDKGVKRLLGGSKGLKDLEELKERFMEHATTKVGLVTAGAEGAWNMIINAAQYTFNIAHSTGYAAQAVQDMWLKCHYPVEFYASAAQYETDKLAQVVMEAAVDGVPVVPPDANKAGFLFDAVDDAVVFSLSAVKNVGDPCAKCVIELREQAGPYKSFDDFEARVETFKRARNANSRQRRCLLEAGAFDSVGGRDGWSDEEKRRAEKELLGFSLSGTVSMLELVTERAEKVQEVRDSGEGTIHIIGGTLTKISPHESRNGPMAFLTIDFEGDSIDVCSFSDTWPIVKTAFGVGDVILVSGKRSEYNGNVNLIMKHVIGAGELLEQS